MKKLLSLVLCISILMACLTIYPSALVQSGPYTVEEKNKIALQIIYAEETKDKNGLSDVDLSSVTISDPINTYTLTEYGLIQNSTFIPVKLNNDLIAWVIKYNVGTSEKYQFSTSYIKKINEIVNSETKFALIYDKSACYLYQGTNYTKLGDMRYENNNGAFITDIDSNDLLDVELKSLENSYQLPEINSNKARLNRYVSVSIERVEQSVYYKLCWAACTLCMVKYYNNGNTDLTIEEISENYFGEFCNLPLPEIEDFEDVLNSYDISGFTAGTSIDEVTVFENLIDGDPVIGVSTIYVLQDSGIYTRQSGTHACVIYGANIFSMYMNLMDPEFGWHTFSYDDGDYIYYVGEEGKYFELEGGVCRSW